MDRIALQAQPRTVLGKKVRFLRRQGVIPVNVFGHAVESEALQVDALALQKAMSRAGTTALIDLRVEGQDSARPVLIRGLQRKPSTGELLHVDLYAVSMTEKIRTQVPIVLVGKAPGLTKGGLLLQNIEHLDIECLPGDLITAADVDISGLVDIDDAVYVRDVNLGPAITVHTPADTVIVKIQQERAEEVETAEAPAAEAAAAEGGAQPTEGTAS